MSHGGKLKLTTPGEREILMQRVFDAPRHLVYEALTRPALVKRWLLGPPGWAMPVCDIDLRVGGRYRYVWSHQDGGEMGMGGVYREIVPGEKLVCTEAFDQFPSESLNTATLLEQDGTTTLTTHILYPSREIRDAVIKSNMENGVNASYDRLAECLAA